MTDAELFNLIAEFNIAGMTAMALYLTAASGYLLVSYLVGANLTRLQLVVITGLFLWFSLFLTYGTVGYFGRALYFFEQLQVKPPGIGMNYWVLVLSAGFEFFGVFACLKFMWDVRHPKTS